MTMTGFTASAFDFTAEALPGPQGPQVKLTGTADMAVRPLLDDLLSKVHQAARDDHAAQVALDLRELAFMNSSCLKGLVAWIGSIQELPTSDQYRVILISSPEMHWQRRSLHALSCLARELITVQS